MAKRKRRIHRLEFEQPHKDADFMDNRTITISINEDCDMTLRERIRYAKWFAHASFGILLNRTVQVAHQVLIPIGLELFRKDAEDGTEYPA